MKKERLKQNYKTCVLSSAFLFFTCCYFPSMEIYLKNYTEFEVQLKYVWWIILFTVFAATLILGVFIAMVENKISLVINMCILAVGICGYVQELWLNGKLHELSGEELCLADQERIINIAEWVVVFVIIVSTLLVVKKRFGNKKVSDIIVIAEVSLLLVQMTGMITLVFNITPKEDKATTYLSSECEYELSSGTNVVYFVLDTCDDLYVSKMLRENPEIFKDLKGFVYYPNNISRYSRTFPSITYMLTGQDYRFNVPASDYFHDAFTQSTFFSDMKAYGTDIRLFTDIAYVYNKDNGTIDNYKTVRAQNLDSFSVINLIKAMMHLAGYRIAPYAFKHVFDYTKDSFNDGVMIRPHDYARQFSDAYFLFDINQNGLSLSDSYNSAFRFYHMYGPHPGCYIDSSGNNAGTLTEPETALEGCINIIKTYLNEMKRLGVYDRSMIVITADHGIQTGNMNDSFELIVPDSSIMLVKKPNQLNKECQISAASVCHENLFAAVNQSLNIVSEKYAPAIWDVKDDNTRFFYHTVKIWGESEGEMVLREYEVNGDARNISNWRLTGNDYDIDFSFNRVSSRRF